ncbi:hypothetical protein K432DRAFT_384551 [Lepidopterella palustris CBS 459.81]|uniref:Nucleolar protein 12 n=1 Tax=Lepidopterella palustris CBS 459.81 TaxID=1314670 RepID=A0A8E2JCQ6_9PEZI|nr:hypothetical protein K432DRAFT_384551 [Lepidopterella palustris CBS 459.81]
MGKKQSNRVERPNPGSSQKTLPFVADTEAVDPALASLFASSLGPVKAPSKSRYQAVPQKPKMSADDEDDEDLSSIESANREDTDDEDLVEEGHGSLEGKSDNDIELEARAPQAEDSLRSVALESLANGRQDRPKNKRKRGSGEEELEDVYMRKLAREEAKEEAKMKSDMRKKRLKTTGSQGDSGDEDNSSKVDDHDKDATNSEDSVSEPADQESYSIPKHETMMPSTDAQELEKASRTVFLGNVSSKAITSKTAKKTLLHHLASFIPSLPPHSPAHKVESLRFRSTAFASAMPKKGAFAKKEVMDATTKSTNAYAVYSTQIAARNAARKLNGTIVLDRHLRVDEVAHPAKVDNRRCVFVGNLGFVDDESSIKAASEQEGQRKSKRKEPADVEEGLWTQFNKAGTVESVRVIRDSKTRVGKGIAYVQFADENGVEAALQFNDQKFPPLLPRKLRVVRAKAFKRNAKQNPSSSNKPISDSIYNPKVSAHEKSMQGRASKLLGRAGAAQVRTGRISFSGPGRPGGTPFKAPETFVFEGHRASSKQGTSGLKLGGSGKKKGGKPKTRSSKRGAAWKASGAKRLEK